MRDHLRTVEQGLDAQEAAQGTARKSAARAR
jgi:hypothetical protein